MRRRRINQSDQPVGGETFPIRDCYQSTGGYLLKIHHLHSRSISPIAVRSAPDLIPETTFEFQKQSLCCKK